MIRGLARLGAKAPSAGQFSLSTKPYGFGIFLLIPFPTILLEYQYDPTLSLPQFSVVVSLRLSVLLWTFRYFSQIITVCECGVYLFWPFVFFW